MTSILDFAGLLYGSSFDVINIPVHCVFDGMSSLNRKNKLTCAFKIQSAFFDYNHLAPCKTRIKSPRGALNVQNKKTVHNIFDVIFQHFQLCDAISHGGGVVGRKRNVRQLNAHCNSCCRTNNCNRNLCGGTVYCVSKVL